MDYLPQMSSWVWPSSTRAANDCLSEKCQRNDKDEEGNIRDPISLDVIDNPDEVLITKSGYCFSDTSVNRWAEELYNNGTSDEIKWVNPITKFDETQEPLHRVKVPGCELEQVFRSKDGYIKDKEVPFYIAKRSLLPRPPFKVETRLSRNNDIRRFPRHLHSYKAWNEQGLSISDTLGGSLLVTSPLTINSDTDPRGYFYAKAETPPPDPISGAEYWPWEWKGYILSGNPNHDFRISSPRSRNERYRGVSMAFFKGTIFRDGFTPPSQRPPPPPSYDHGWYYPETPRWYAKKTPKASAPFTWHWLRECVYGVEGWVCGYNISRSSVKLSNAVDFARKHKQPITPYLTDPYEEGPQENSIYYILPPGDSETEEDEEDEFSRAMDAMFKYSPGLTTA